MDGITSAAAWLARQPNPDLIIQRYAELAAHASSAMLAMGYEQIDAIETARLTDDGREILHAHGKAWALRPEIHAQRLAEAMEQARQRDTAMAARGQAATPQPPTVCASLIDGQLCGGTLVMSPVCPRCALGKSGVSATLTCDVCGHVTAIMRGENDG